MDKDNYGNDYDQKMTNEEFSPGTVDEEPQFDLDLTDEIEKVDKKDDQ